MKCPECGSKKLPVGDTIRAEDAVIRYRGCVFCGARMVTKEQILRKTSIYTKRAKRSKK